MASPQRHSRDDLNLGRLLSEVNMARAQTRVDATSKNHLKLKARRTDLLVALEEYADAAAASGVPLHYRILNELHLYRSMLPRPS